MWPSLERWVSKVRERVEWSVTSRAGRRIRAGNEIYRVGRHGEWVNEWKWLARKRSRKSGDLRA